MVNQHGPEALKFNALNITAWDEDNKWYMDSVPFSKYNDQGYQFAAVVNRDYELTWNTAVRIDPSEYVLHDVEALEQGDW
eukprot:1182448-Prorocentrum_minimum.AAC.6